MELFGYEHKLAAIDCILNLLGSEGLVCARWEVVAEVLSSHVHRYHHHRERQLAIRKPGSYTDQTASGWSAKTTYDNEKHDVVVDL